MTPGSDLLRLQQQGGGEGGNCAARHLVLLSCTLPVPVYLYLYLTALYSVPVPIPVYLYLTALVATALYSCRALHPECLADCSCSTLQCCIAMHCSSCTYLLLQDALSLAPIPAKHFLLNIDHHKDDQMKITTRITRITKMMMR